MKEQLCETKEQLAQDPGNPRLLRQLGWLYLNSHCFKKANEEYALAVTRAPRLASEIILDHERLIETEPQNSMARLSLVSFLLNNSEFEAAILELEELLEINSNDARSYNLLGKLYIQLNRIDAALSLLEKALATGVNDIGISQMLAGVYLEKGRFEEAIRFYEDLIKHLPSDKNILRTLGELYTRTGKLNRAAERFGGLFALDPESAGEVIKKLEALLLKDETNLKVREVLSHIYMRSLKPDRAAETLREILLLDPQKIDFVIEKNKIILKNYPNHPQALLTLASVLAQKGDFSEAIENFKQLIKNHPDFKEEAIEGARDILKKYPDQYLANQFLAETHLLDGNFSEAIAELHRLLSLHQESADWILSKLKDLTKKEARLFEITGYAWLKKENSDRALVEAEALMANDKEYAPAHILFGKIYLAKNLTRKARESFLSALKLDPYNITIHSLVKEASVKELSLEEESLKKRSAHFDLAKIYIGMERREEALRELQLARGDERVPIQIAELYIEEGRFNLAQAALINQNGHPSILNQARFKLAACYEAQGNIKKAIKVLEEIQAYEMEYPGLEQKIKFLKSSSLKSLQNRTLALLIFNPESRATYAFWGRESKSGSKKQNITASFGLSHNNAGFDYYIKGMLKAAREEFDLASKIDPAFSAAGNNLGATYVAEGRAGEALQKFREALRIEGGSAVFLNNFGVASFLEKDLAQAEKYFDLAHENDPELSAAAINRGDLAYLNGRAKKAVESYQTVKNHDLLYSLARKRLLYKTA
ncbi:hypothetical protein A2276_06540 [candidate division WOR-1 bacterium RIFOXYA12_FULL_43_27]|uniref:Tetratricopeptide repeat protein n=1 Tax=candidate division WOR-1 bacterium RIFOXYC2_FULL_46_14 TaxID=1802587 RepID=A0A1F4U5Q7_UNCSA|nr:MAG: hypothetical protein A2276_06540 [candidate division WOR-1 bacterium RIFOXYA12_FULL_43_27]OGC20304.1 MAG: hypothetical protein A2292_04540 [candidate division WOR-1 bacterium RIFOXYB2_FULL_46_45]OGC31959.1 MAG: hypothetical protein A2232_06910 [candidate division WOR-1 bacterium RIFOXYA2_FULL_46_56]OGC40150.1 MAG: hypothetical protein A2438_02560 [candidate division WOR-1 bacterium RIFOXYC2_FULL_46_14]